jgi:hypothetical protein
MSKKMSVKLNKSTDYSCGNIDEIKQDPAEKLPKDSVFCFSLR